jgi:hypothetical protein
MVSLCNLSMTNVWLFAVLNWKKIIFRPNIFLNFKFSITEKIIKILFLVVEVLIDQNRWFRQGNIFFFFLLKVKEKMT